jgi:DNA-binding response OmpR family regulator
VARILIVEDEPLISMMLEDWLVEMGHQALGPAGSVDQALELARNAKFDAAILDVNLQRERCDPVADVLTNRRVPFAFATGEGAASIDKRFAGSPTLSKPYDFIAVQSVIGKMLPFNEQSVASRSGAPNAS